MFAILVYFLVFFVSFPVIVLPCRAKKSGVENPPAKSNGPPKALKKVEKKAANPGKAPTKKQITEKAKPDEPNAEEKDTKAKRKKRVGDKVAADPAAAKPENDVKPKPRVRMLEMKAETAKKKPPMEVISSPKIDVKKDIDEKGLVSNPFITEVSDEFPTVEETK